MNDETRVLAPGINDLHTARLLLVEDERIVARSLTKDLHTLGYEVVNCSHSGEDAIQKIGILHPDLILMDIKLEGPMDGVETAAHIRAQFGLPVVYLTANSDRELLERVKITEPFGYVLKPYDARELEVVIETSLYRHRMEQHQRERERWFVATLNSIGDAVLATDEGRCITYMNPLAERLTGWARQDALGNVLKDVVHLVNEKSQQPVDNPFEHGSQDGRPISCNLLIAKSGSKIAIEECVSLIADERGGALGRVAVFRDVSWRKELEHNFAARGVQAENMRQDGHKLGGPGLANKKRRTQGEMEAAVCDWISHFEQEYRGRGPRIIHARFFDDLLVIRLQGLLTPSEQYVASIPSDKGRDLVKQVRTQIIEAAKPRIEAMVHEITGVRLVSLHHDISVMTGEAIVAITLAAVPSYRSIRR